MIFALQLLIIAAAALSAGNADAYIGPGAGFAFFSSFLVFIITFALVIFYFISLPARMIFNAVFRRNAKAKGPYRQVIILGLDGMDPGLTDRFMNQEKLPNFLRLKESGTFTPLATSFPAISPVAWSSFLTGLDPSYHGIFDFLSRDATTYSPVLSSAEIKEARRNLSVGKFRIPLGRPRLRILRKGKAFWKILGEHGVFSSIIRVPITFPPEKFNGLLLSGMCVPDLLGSQGTFSFYTTNDAYGNGMTGGACFSISFNSGTAYTHLYGPQNTMMKGAGAMKTPLSITLEQGNSTAVIRVCGSEYRLEKERYSPWIPIEFNPSPGVKVKGICKFYLLNIYPHVELYVTPINIDPDRPALPISHPYVYSVYLSKMIGPYATLGLAEDTWALNEGIIDEEAFLKQAYCYFEEREKMLFKALDRNTRGLNVCVFDTTDRIQHMFFRCLDNTHPANIGKETDKYKNVIEDLYVRMDGLLGKVFERVGNDTLLIVMSDHGFAQFKRGVNLNTWLLQNGYLAVRDGSRLSGDWFENIDWSRTRAFSFGLTGIYINKKDREPQGIVREGEELKTVKEEIIEKLTGLIDDGKNVKAIVKAVDSEGYFSGPYVSDGPDILVCYNRGYRSSWACAKGRITESVFEDNTKRWSGDHCVAPELVPGIFFSNVKTNTKTPDIKDIAPTVLKAFGVESPTNMKGSSLINT